MKSKNPEKMKILLKQIRNLVVLKILDAENLISDGKYIIDSYESEISRAYFYIDMNEDLNNWVNNKLNDTIRLNINFDYGSTQLICKKCEDEILAEILLYQIINTLNCHFETKIKLYSSTDNIYEFTKG